MKILFLDDCPERTKKFKAHVPEATCVEDAKSCIDQIKEKDWDFVFLDHDLGGEVFVNTDREDCGMEVVRFLKKNKKSIRTIFCHSLNEPASNLMTQHLRDAGYSVVQSPFLLFDWDNIHRILTEITSSSD